MNLTHRLRLPVPPEQGWAAFRDPRRLAEALPGASVDDVDPDHAADAADRDRISGTLKVKLGPLALAFDGSLEVAEHDQHHGRLVWRTQAADRRGHGTAQARHTIVLRPAGASGRESEAEIHTELNLTGRPAQLGRGVVSDAVDRLIGRFGTLTASRVAQGLPWLPGTELFPSAAAADGVEQPAERSEAPGAVQGQPAAPPRPLPPSVRPPAPDAWDAHPPGPSGFIRLLPWAVSGLLVAAAVVRLVRRRARS